MLKFLWILLPFATSSPCPQNTFYLIGSYRPQCTDSGAWAPKQCWGSTGTCWCVDSEGTRVSSEVDIGTELDCTTVSNDVHS